MIAGFRGDVNHGQAVSLCGAAVLCDSDLKVGVYLDNAVVVVLVHARDLDIAAERNRRAVKRDGAAFAERNFEVLGGEDRVERIRELIRDFAEIDVSVRFQFTGLFDRAVGCEDVGGGGNVSGGRDRDLGAANSNYRAAEAVVGFVCVKSYGNVHRIIVGT